ncbi:MAG: peptide chain release factor 1 [Candidatus Woykebacteria bacterium]
MYRKGLNSNLAKMEYLKRQIEEVDKKIQEAKKLLDDPSLSSLATEEVKKLSQEKENLEKSINQEAKKPSENLDAHDVIIEIRAAAGGSEAGLFASDLYRMYTRFAEGKGWKVEHLSLNEGGIGNIKEVTFRISGQGAYGNLKYESGVHRVQRVPTTESSGRIHTSTTTVAVLPQLEDKEFHLEPTDIKLDTFHASGHGGQNVQKVESAVRLTHITTGIVATCQTERSQFQNKERALSILRSRVYEHEQAQKKESVDSNRKLQVGTGDRAEKIRTYNFPQDRITDHRINKSWHHIEEILDGNLDTISHDIEKFQSNDD